MNPYIICGKSIHEGIHSILYGYDWLSHQDAITCHALSGMAKEYLAAGRFVGSLSLASAPDSKENRRDCGGSAHRRPEAGCPLPRAELRDSPLPIGQGRTFSFESGARVAATA
jgi:hypothetical protein